MRTDYSKGRAGGVTVGRCVAARLMTHDTATTLVVCRQYHSGAVYFTNPHDRKSKRKERYNLLEKDTL